MWISLINRYLISPLIIYSYTCEHTYIHSINKWTLITYKVTAIPQIFQSKYWEHRVVVMFVDYVMGDAKQSHVILCWNSKIVQKPSYLQTIYLVKKIYQITNPHILLFLYRLSDVFTVLYYRYHHIFFHNF